MKESRRERKKMLCSRVSLRRERKGQGAEIRLIFLPKLSFQMWEEKEGKERRGLKKFIKLHIYPSITFYCKINKGMIVKVATFLSFLSYSRT